MQTPEFVLMQIDPKLLKVHPFLSDMGFDNRPDEIYNLELKNFGFHFERPIIDAEYNILTHSADVIAAQENNFASIEVFSVVLDDAHKRRLIALKHRYNIRKQILNYNTSLFCKSYLTEDAQGIDFAKTLPGKTTREKVAGLLNTSDSTIKRLWFIGDSMPEELGLIDAGYSSLKEAEEKVKIAKWKKEQALKKEQEASKNKCESQEGGDSKSEIIEHLLHNNEKENLPVNTPIQHQVELGNEIGESEYYESSIQEETQQTQNDTAYFLSNVSFAIEGMGDFAANVTGDKAELIVNGIPIDGVHYLSRTNLNPVKYANVNSFIFQENSLNGLNIQIIISNFKK